MTNTKRWDAPKGTTIQEADNGEFVLASEFEGEIAMRDARIGELENDASYYAARNEELRADLAAIKAREPVMPERLKPSRYEIQDARVDAWNSCLDEIARLNAAPVQQVSVAGGWADRLYKTLSEAVSELSTLQSYVREVAVEGENEESLEVCDATDESIENMQRVLNEYRAMLAAAPAAPAADAGLVEALEKLARIGNGDQYGNSDGNMIAQEALAAHRAAPAPGGE